MADAKKLIQLGLDEISRLAGVAYSAHQRVAKYHHENEKYDPAPDRVEVSNAMENQYKWVRALREALE